MTAKDALLTWNDGVKLAEGRKYREAIEKFSLVKDNIHASPAKMNFNISTIQFLLGEYSSALESLNESIKRDSLSAVSYFQRGVVFHAMQRYEDARKEFVVCSGYLRNGFVDYSQLGLKCKLFKCEALYNAGVCLVKAGRKEEALEAFGAIQSAQGDSAEIKTLTKHVDAGAALERAKAGSADFTLLDCVKDRLYTPPLAKMKNLATKDYLGKATVVSSVTDKDTFSGFVGPRKLQSAAEEPAAPPPKPARTTETPPAASPQLAAARPAMPSAAPPQRPTQSPRLARQIPLLEAEQEREAPPLYQAPPPPGDPVTSRSGLPSHRAPPGRPEKPLDDDDGTVAPPLLPRKRGSQAADPPEGRNTSVASQRNIVAEFQEGISRSSASAEAIAMPTAANVVAAATAVATSERQAPADAAGNAEPRSNSISDRIKLFQSAPEAPTHVSSQRPSPRWSKTTEQKPADTEPRGARTWERHQDVRVASAGPKDSSTNIASQQPGSSAGNIAVQRSTPARIAGRLKKSSDGSVQSHDDTADKNSFINVDIIIGEEVEALCVKMETLDVLQSKVAEKISCPADSFSLWYEDQAGTKMMIDSEGELQRVWTTGAAAGGRVQLWCYARW